MLRWLELQNLGPCKQAKLELGKRLTVITGDNGVGKSFFLDVAFWIMTDQWPGELNAAVLSGLKAIPTSHQTEASISFSVRGHEVIGQAYFERETRSWNRNYHFSDASSMVIYAMADGSFALWEPASNGSSEMNAASADDQLPAYVFSNYELWNGVMQPDGTSICDGIIRDVGTWVKEQGQSFQHFNELLGCFTLGGHSISLGELQEPKSNRDRRPIPTINYGIEQNVSILNVSSAVKRVIAFSYIYFWGLQTNTFFSKRNEKTSVKQLVVLFDEPEAHLHPLGQRDIIPGLLKMFSKSTLEHQLVFTTHSPVLLGSLEAIFTSTQDVWQDFDILDGSAVVNNRDFEVQGDYGRWLTTEAFNFATTKTPNADVVAMEVRNYIERKIHDESLATELSRKVKKHLNPVNPMYNVWFSYLDSQHRQLTNS